MRLRARFGSKRLNVREDWSKVHIEELRELYGTTKINWINKSRGIRWTRYVARMGKLINVKKD
jgi:uncharacterized alpha/beta hydrolase family protein